MGEMDKSQKAEEGSAAEDILKQDLGQLNEGRLYGEDSPPPHRPPHAFQRPFKRITKE